MANWVVSTNTTDTFKARLDKFWHNQFKISYGSLFILFYFIYYATGAAHKKHIYT